MDSLKIFMFYTIYMHIQGHIFSNFCIGFFFGDFDGPLPAEELNPGAAEEDDPMRGRVMACILSNSF